jgi:hypothetical protein
MTTRLHFLKENLSGTATAAMALLPYGGTEYYAQHAGRVKSVTALLTEPRTGGSLTVKVTKNGAAQTVLNLTLDGSAPQYDETFGDSDDLTFAAGDRIGLQAVTASWTPTTSDAVGLLEVEE